MLPISFSFLHPAVGLLLPGIYASPRRMRRAVAPTKEWDGCTMKDPFELLREWNSFVNIAPGSSVGQRLLDNKGQPLEEAELK